MPTEMGVVVFFLEGVYVRNGLLPLAYPAIGPFGRGRRGPEPGWHRACCRCQQCRGSCPGVVENAAAQDVCNGDRLREGRRTVRNHRGRESLLCRFRGPLPLDRPGLRRSEEHTSELQSLMRNSYAVFCLKKKHNI